MEYTFKFREEEVNLIMKGLGELPAKESIGMLQKIAGLAQQQQKQQQAPNVADVATPVSREDITP